MPYFAAYCAFSEFGRVVHKFLECRVVHKFLIPSGLKAQSWALYQSCFPGHNCC